MAPASDDFDAAPIDAVSLDAALRRSDPDRWLSSRFIADADQRADVVALYAFDSELSQVVAGGREALAAEIRLTWWAEALDDLFGDKPARRHPVLEALAIAIARRGLLRAPLEAMVEARFAALGGASFESEEALDRYIDDTAGAVTGLSLSVLGCADAAAGRPAARAWALTGLIRQRDHAGLDRFPMGYDAVQAARQALVEARTGAANLPVAAFPAVAHVTLAKAYMAGDNPLGLIKRLRMIRAVITGRI